MTLPDPSDFPRGAAGTADERATIVCHRNGRVLLVARRPSSRWTLPGGVIRRGESALDAAHRELREETGLVDLELAYFCYVDGSVKRHHVFVAGLRARACPGARSHCAAGFTSKPCRAGRPARRRNASSASSRASVPGTASPRTTARVRVSLSRQPVPADRPPAVARTPSTRQATASVRPAALRSLACRLPFAARPRRVRQLEWPSVGACTRCACPARPPRRARHAAQPSTTACRSDSSIWPVRVTRPRSTRTSTSRGRATSRPSAERTRSATCTSLASPASQSARRPAIAPRAVGRPLCLRARIVRHFASACDRRVTDLRAPPPARRRIEVHGGRAAGNGHRKIQQRVRRDSGVHGSTVGNTRNDRASSSCAARSVPRPTVAYTRPRCSLATETTTA